MSPKLGPTPRTKWSEWLRCLAFAYRASFLLPFNICNTFIFLCQSGWGHQLMHCPQRTPSKIEHSHRTLPLREDVLLFPWAIAATTLFQGRELEPSPKEVRKRGLIYYSHIFQLVEALCSLDGSLASPSITGLPSFLAMKAISWSEQVEYVAPETPKNPKNHRGKDSQATASARKPLYDSSP